MSEDREDARQEGDAHIETTSVSRNERREALIKLGKYAAYATPIVIASVSAAYGTAPISGAPTPSPGPPA